MSSLDDRSGSPRFPAVILVVAALGFAVWAAVLIVSPGGPVVLEWTILIVALFMLGFGLISARSADSGRARLIRWVLVGFAVFGAVVVIGLTADDNSSRTWFRLGWAALVAGSLASFAVWWSAPGARRSTVIAGGVAGLVVIAAGAGISVNCDRTLQRSWCEPAFEQEEALAARVEVDGQPDRSGRAGGDTGAYIRAFFVDGTDIEAVTTVPDPFSFEPRDIQSIEVSRGRYTAASGQDANCQIDVKVEEVPAGNLLTLTVSCSSEVD